LVALVWAPLLVGCATDAEHTRGVTVAFESVDGPPPVVFDRLVSHLAAEARMQKIAVVSRRAPARYRVRAYLAAKIEPRRTSVAWVWDVYDSDLQRATRIAGEEVADRDGRNAWAAADDRLVGRIAESGMRELATFFSGQGTAPRGGGPTAPELTPSTPTEPPAAPVDNGIRVATSELVTDASSQASR
jgi:hypothetical protein